MSVTSPTFSSVSDDSFQHLALSSSSISHSRLDPDASSDDEIVWSVSEADLSSSASMISLASPYPPTSPADSEDEDFVVLSRNSATRVEDVRPHNASTPCLTSQPLVSDLTPETLAWQMEELAINARDGHTSQIERNVQSATPSPTGQKRRNRRKRNVSTPQPQETAPPPPPPSAAHSGLNKQEFSKKKRKSRSTGLRALSAQPIVDDLSDVSSDVGAQKNSEEYQSAVKFIDAFLSDPASKDRTSRLTLLQSMIIELGLESANAAVPSSIKAATTFLKSRVFVNIRDYLATRSQGPEALQKVMYPSKSALIRDLKRTRGYAPKEHVKASGLQVLLVSRYF